MTASSSDGLATSQPIILGTAGHIDHGKTALVQALTGIDTDRLKVEKERGITTELGFAHLDLDGRRFGFVDVPGHERFIRAMVAGAAGIDVVVLAIAADEGIMPQTREHLDICALLGVRRILIAITKADLVDAEWLDLVGEEIREQLAGTFASDAPMFPVSAKTGAGLAELRTAFARAADELPGRSADGLFRMPLDRVFTMRGFGTVVTGTITGGRVTVGEQVAILPAGITGKVRGLQVHGAPAQSAPAGLRCAVNLSGVDRDQVARGQWLVHPQAIEPTHIVDAEFRYLPSSRSPLARRSRVLLHHGTTQVAGSVVLIDRDQLAPGESCLVQLRIDATTPLVALPGDRFIARGFVVQEHYGTTLGGGQIVRVHAPKVRRSSAQAIDSVRAVAQADTLERVALEIERRGPAGLSESALYGSLGVDRGRCDSALAQLAQERQIIEFADRGERWFCHARTFASLESIALRALQEQGTDRGQGWELPKAELAGRMPRSMPARLFDEVVAELVDKGSLRLEGDRALRPNKRARPAERDPLTDELLSAFREWKLAPPRPKEIPAKLAVDGHKASRALDDLLRAGDIVRVRADLYVGATALDDLRQRLTAYLSEHGQIAPAAWKELTGVSRKYSIPLAEYFDSEKLTLRIGDIRKLRR